MAVACWRAWAGLAKTPPPDGRQPQPWHSMWSAARHAPGAAAAVTADKDLEERKRRDLSP